MKPCLGCCLTLGMSAEMGDDWVRARQESWASTSVMPNQLCRLLVSLQGQLYLRGAGLCNQTPSLWLMLLSVFRNRTQLGTTQHSSPKTLFTAHNSACGHGNKLNPFHLQSREMWKKLTSNKLQGKKTGKKITQTVWSQTVLNAQALCHVFLICGQKDVLFHFCNSPLKKGIFFIFWRRESQTGKLALV